MNRHLNILQISTFDKAGGAELIAWNLFISYNRLNHHSWMAVGTKKTNNPDIFSISKNHSIPQSKIIITKIKRFFGFLKGHEDFEHPETWNILNLPPEIPDIVHCHNLHRNYFDLRILPIFSYQIPTVLTLHDAWMLSGHCAHSFSCNLWKTGCGNCPDLSIYPEIRRDATSYNWQQKSEIFKKSRLYIVTPSKWLMNKVHQSMLKPSIIKSKVIPNGVDLKTFFPADQIAARINLGLPKDAKIIMFASNGIRKNIWKDYRTLRSAIDKLPPDLNNILCIALGEKAPSEFINKIEIRFIPYQQNPTTIAQYYQAADIYVHPAKADNFPTTILEALACGLPVIATRVGGIPEQIIEEKTGYLVPIGDGDTMAKKITKLLTNNELKIMMGKEAVKDAKQRFGLKRMVDDYLEFYSEIIKEK